LYSEIIVVLTVFYGPRVYQESNKSRFSDLVAATSYFTR